MWVKQAISWFLVFMILFSSASLLREPAGSTEDWENPYIDVTQDLWSYQYITELNKAGVLPSSEKFQGQEEETRGNLVLYLYNMDQGVFKDRKKSRDKKKEKAAPNFTDVTKDYLTILNQIIEKNPGVQIVVQSVTPMADSSTSYSEKLNNEQINAFNETMKAYCQDNRWYYVNVAEAFKDEKGFLKKEYCRDYGSMGMHFTYEGAKIWVQYLNTHIPQDLL